VLNLFSIPSSQLEEGGKQGGKKYPGGKTVARIGVVAAAWVGLLDSNSAAVMLVERTSDAVEWRWATLQCRHAAASCHSQRAVKERSALM
jgi:hypothetical protein